MRKKPDSCAPEPENETKLKKQDDYYLAVIQETRIMGEQKCYETSNSF